MSLNFPFVLTTARRSRGINTVEELCNKTSDDMMKVRNLGRKSLEEVLAKLKELGLQLQPTEE